MRDIDDLNKKIEALTLDINALESEIDQEKKENESQSDARTKLE